MVGQNIASDYSILCRTHFANGVHGWLSVITNHHFNEIQWKRLCNVYRINNSYMRLHWPALCAADNDADDEVDIFA